MSAPTITPTIDTVIPKGPVTLVRVLEGEGPGTPRRGSKQLFAKSECSYYCRNSEVVQAVIEALRQSDEKLRARPEELMLWDWQSTWYRADLDSDTGAGWVLLGVAWYHEEFYRDRGDAYLSVMHKKLYDMLGLRLEDVEVVHYLVDQGQAA